MRNRLQCELAFLTHPDLSDDIVFARGAVSLDDIAMYRETPEGKVELTLVTNDIVIIRTPFDEFEKALAEFENNLKELDDATEQD